MDKKRTNAIPIIAYIIASLFIIVISMHCINEWDFLKGTEQEGNIIKAILDGLLHFEEKPFEIVNSVSLIGGMASVLLILIMIFLLIVYDKKTTLFNREFGSSRWATRKEERAFEDKDKEKNVILSSDIKMSLNGRVSKRNTNILCVGGSGSGKTRFFAMPNVMQANCSYVITDPKGTTFKSSAKLLEQEGYEILLFNLIEKEYSGCYNFFEYIHKESDILMVANLLIKSTDSQEGQGAKDPFWDNAAILWVEAVIAYIWMELEEEEKSIETVMYLLDIATASEEDENQMSELDEIFEKLQEKKGKKYFPCKQYGLYKKAAGKTAKSILITIGAKLSPFNIKEVRELTKTDTLHLNTIGNKKKALFIVIPDTDKSLNFLVSMLYTQLFNELFFQADFGEIQWNKGQAYYHSRESLIDKRDQLEKHMKQYLVAEGEKKRNRLYKEIYSQMDEVEKEFGIPPLKERILKEENFELYKESLDDLSRRMNNRKEQLQTYYNQLVHINKGLCRIYKNKSGNISNIEKRKIERMEHVKCLIKKRLLYEYGIQSSYKGRFAEEKFLEDIKILIKELKKNNNSYGAENTLRERIDRIEMKKKRLKLLSTSLRNDFKWYEKTKKETIRKEIKKEKTEIQVIETATFFEFGIKDLSKRMNGGRLPVHVRCILDEFANITPIPEFQKILAVMRSREVSASIILQNLAQLKEMYKDSWENISGNCDTFVFLGGQEQQTLEYVSKKLGKLTLDKRSNGLNRGGHGGSSENWDKLGRELKTADEISRMPNEDCIIFVRGMYPYYSKKYNINKHKRYQYVCDDNENESDPNFYQYKTIFVTEKAGDKALSEKEKEENYGLIRKSINNTIRARIFNEKRGNALRNASSFKGIIDKMEKKNRKGELESIDRKIIKNSIDNDYVKDIPYAIEMSAAQMLDEIRSRKESVEINDRRIDNREKFINSEKVVHDELFSYGEEKFINSEKVVHDEPFLYGEEIEELLFSD